MVLVVSQLQLDQYQIIPDIPLVSTTSHIVPVVLLEHRLGVMLPEDDFKAYLPEATQHGRLILLRPTPSHRITPKVHTMHRARIILNLPTIPRARIMLNQVITPKAPITANQRINLLIL